MGRPPTDIEGGREERCTSKTSRGGLSGSASRQVRRLGLRLSRQPPLKGDLEEVKQRRSTYNLVSHHPAYVDGRLGGGEPSPDPPRLHLTST
ncbi:MAG: hypothetical protein QXO15_02670 [Nitrososphaerota archaeon]